MREPWHACEVLLIHIVLCEKGRRGMGTSNLGYSRAIPHFMLIRGMRVTDNRPPSSPLISKLLIVNAFDPQENL